MENTPAFLTKWQKYGIVVTEKLLGVAMRILFDSKKTCYKSPFGTLSQGQDCTLHIHIPTSVPVAEVCCMFCRENGELAFSVEMPLLRVEEPYGIYMGTFCITEPGLYFYHFLIRKDVGAFRLFKQGDMTNMEAGDCWQITCTPRDFTTPDWALGAVIYQVFPDRFAKSGACDLSGKLTPYRIHSHWNEEVEWAPNSDGIILNNDFFGGNFQGITEKMDYIASFGTEILYLNPISKSFSSHRYDTGDYKTPDPMLGTIEDFTALCDAAHARGIRVILDGVFSHTGADSLYFNKYGNFPTEGAYQSLQSSYASWYQFSQHPDHYKSWWGFDTLPTVDKTSPAFIDYIIDAPDSVVAHWLALGADGFRLDVADELPDAFILRLRNRMRSIRPDSLLIGEVWEDASNKIAYDIRRRYFVDGELDSCMNYPFRTAIMNFMRKTDDGPALKEAVMTIAENYPRQVLLANMNLLGSHDTPRILTALLGDFEGSREEMSRRHLSETQRKLAENRLLIAVFLQFMLPGSPSIYYGDETGMEGDKDPFNRRTFPWGQENPALQSFFRSMGLLHKASPALRLGDIQFFCAENGKLGFTRRYESQTFKIYVNYSDEDWELPAGNFLLHRNLRAESDVPCRLSPMGFCICQ